MLTIFIKQFCCYVQSRLVGYSDMVEKPMLYTSIFEKKKRDHVTGDNTIA